MAALQLILYIGIKGGGLHEILGGRLRRWEKAKWGNLWDWIKVNWRDRYFFYIGGYRTVKS